MDIWQYYKSITRRPLAWSAVSVIAGVALLFFGPLWRGVGIQALAIALPPTPARGWKN